MISGAAYVVKALQEEKVEFLFNYPGAATIDIMDELYKQDQVKVILPRHEQALAHAADGYARSTGKVGVCMVTSGPGATNLVTGIATAYADSVPMVCITGQVDLSLMGNDAFQEVDTVGIVRNVCKYAITVRDRKDLGRNSERILLHCSHRPSRSCCSRYSKEYSKSDGHRGISNRGKYSRI